MAVWGTHTCAGMNSERLGQRLFLSVDQPREVDDMLLTLACPSWAIAALLAASKIWHFGTASSKKC